MATYNLIPRQKQLLGLIVKNLLAGTLENMDDQIIPSCSMEHCEIIGLEQKFGTNLISDLNALCDADLMDFRTNKDSGIYTVKQSGYEAVENEFVIPRELANTPLNIGAYINQVTGGNVQAIGRVENSQISQVINDPKLLNQELTRLINELLESIRNDLPAEKLLDYRKLTEELKSEISSKDTSPSTLKRLFSALAFLGDIEGTISLTTRIWLHLYPILVIAAEKLMQAAH